MLIFHPFMVTITHSNPWVTTPWRTGDPTSCSCRPSRLRWSRVPRPWRHGPGAERWDALGRAAHGEHDGPRGQWRGRGGPGGLLRCWGGGNFFGDELGVLTDQLSFYEFGLVNLVGFGWIWHSGGPKTSRLAVLGEVLSKRSPSPWHGVCLVPQVASPPSSHHLSGGPTIDGTHVLEIREGLPQQTHH